MKQILTNVGFANPYALSFGTLCRHISQTGMNGVGDDCLDTMSRERLEDLGIAPTTDANLRTSGESGPIPRASL